MSDILDALALATDAQRRATTPDHSAWVEANAGTGKTKVLTDRVTRLLLNEVKPERILCLTFTKAAAAEMRNRLAHQLGRWALTDEAALDSGIAKLIDTAPTPAQRVVARRLFARVLDAPGGINILTIHAFCQALLKRFPLEAGVAPGFEILDEAEAQTILRRVQDEQLEALARSDAPPALAAALASVAGKVSIAEYAELMTRLLSERAWLLARIGDEAGLQRVRARLAREMGCGVDDTADSLTADACLEAAFDSAALREAARALAKGGKQDKARAATIAEWLASTDRPSLLTGYAGAFFTAKGEILARLATKAAIAEMPTIEDVLLREARRLAEILDRINGAALVERTLALLRLGLDIADRYTRAKRRRAVLDYDDLIVATRRLLETAESAAWVLFKLDGGIDHVLVDEAQDTNPDQWEVIRRLTEEFFVGEGAVGRSRTIFAVGDTKQSIFGFQRADPRKLKEMREWFDERSRVADRIFVPVELNVSFRSTPAVLDAVDWVFGEIEAAKGVAEPGDVIHLPSRKNEPGRVELWPLVVGSDDKVDTSDIDGAGSSGGLALPHQRLAQLIAVHAKELIGRERRARDGEKLHAGHFMVLVRRRNEFVNALVRALKREGVEVAGVDRLNLGQELAIQDLLAMARFVLLPQDDLNLAALLKSPLVGLDEDQLFSLAWKRPGHLWRALRERAAETPFAAAYATLADWLKRADYDTPFDFFARALGPQGGRRRLLERLGREASDPIDELLARALQYQGIEGGSLQGFLRWFETGGGEIKRDLDQNRRRELRILTVHASKGLQAPIVYLPDTTRVPRDSDRLLAGAEGEARLWLPRTDDANEAARTWRSEARERALEEQNRLLYVAMTRAEDRLYVGGWVGSKKPDRGCWYERIETGLRASSEAGGPGDALQTRTRAVARPFDFTAALGPDGWSGDGYELVNEGHIVEAEQPELPIADEAPLPDWWTAPAPGEPDPPTPLAPSQPLPDEATSGPRAYSPLIADDPRRWQRGLLLHDLLRHLPGLPPADRADAARRFLAQPAHGLSSEDIEQWAGEALAVTEAPAHAALFAPGSRAEVPLIGTLQTPRGTFTVSGQVDRLAVSEAEVLIVDYKTNRPPPDSAEGVALVYRRQLALYRALLQRIYPGRRVRAFLLWTAAPRLMEIAEETLDKSMPYATAS